MNLVETVGMMSTGALVMLGGVYLVDHLQGPDTPPATVQIVTAQPPTTQAAGLAAPQPAGIAQAPAVAAQQPTAAIEVTRTRSDLTGSASIGQLESFVSLSLQPRASDAPLTAEQEEIIAFFRRTARDLNSVSEGYSGEYVAFNDMSINRLEIRHFYTVRQSLGEVPVDVLLASQADLVQANICEEPMMRTLMDEHGFRFTYSYISQDNRFIGNVRGDTQSCGF